MVCLVAIVLCFITFYLLGTSPYNTASHLLVDSSSTLTTFSFGFLLFLATPFIALIYLGLKILLGQRSRVRWLKSALFVSWFIGLILLMLTAGKVLFDFRDEGQAKRSTTLMQPSNGNLYVQLTDSTGKKINVNDDDENSFNINALGGHLYINGVDFNDIDLIPLQKPSLQIMASENDSFYIQEIITSHGRTRPVAVKNAEMAIYSLNQTDSILNLGAYLYIGKTAKWRGQDMKLKIAIPEGKKISFADNIDMWRATVKGDANYDDTYFANTVWTVEKGQVKCIEGENHRDADNEKKSEKAEQKSKTQVEKMTKSEKDNDDSEKPEKDKDDKDEDF
jgi:energy-coupling factor transporter transmembrane protein EcfT